LLYTNVITITKYQKNKILEYCKGSNIKILRNFIPIIKVNREYHTFLANNNNVIKFAFIGRCHHQKNVHILIESINEYYLSKSFVDPDLELSIIGCCEDTVEFKLLNDMTNGRWVVKGHPWTNNPYEIYMDGLLLPSKYEGDPLVIHECRLRRIPVFCEAIDELSEILYYVEKINFTRKDSIKRIVTDYYTIRSMSSQICREEAQKNSKFERDSFNFLERIS
jgi:glycosyltransferase involved in cell wall biosynthesis